MGKITWREKEISAQQKKISRYGKFALYLIKICLWLKSIYSWRKRREMKTMSELEVDLKRLKKAALHTSMTDSLSCSVELCRLIQADDPSWKRYNKWNVISLLFVSEMGEKDFRSLINEFPEFKEGDIVDLRLQFQTFDLNQDGIIDFKEL